MRSFLWSRLALKTAAVTIGAAIVFANSPWYCPRQRQYDFNKLQAAVLKKLDSTGQLIKATELWRERGAVINVVRRVGWPLCREVRVDAHTCACIYMYMYKYICRTCACNVFGCVWLREETACAWAYAAFASLWVTEWLNLCTTTVHMTFSWKQINTLIFRSQTNHLCIG